MLYWAFKMTKKNQNIKNYSISNKLREENKSNDYFEVMLGNVSLEDLIALKLEIAFRSAGTVIYGLPIWKNTLFIFKDAILKFGISVCKDQNELSKFLGISRMQVFRLLKQFKTIEYFLNKNGR